MVAAPPPYDEAQRLAALYSLHILDSPPEERFDRITRLVAAYFAISIVALNFIATARQWTKSHVGMTILEAPRDSSLCTYTILENHVLVVSDTHRDPRFWNTPMVTAAPYLRCYAGVPVRDGRGYAVASLCIADTQPRTFTMAELAVLQDFAALVEQELLVTTVGTAFLQVQAAEDALRISEAQRRAVFESLHEGVMLQRPDGTFALWNARALQLTGLTEAMMRGQQSTVVGWHTTYDDGRPFAFADHPGMVALQTGQPQFNVIMQVHHPGASIVWIQINAQLVRDAPDGPVLGVVSSFVDITHLKAVEQHLYAAQQQLEATNHQLTMLATTDALTGVLNRRALMERLEIFMNTALRMTTPLALLLLDVDHFKAFNDTFGHPAGDMVLQTVAQLLSAASRVDDLVARYGGEEFAVLLPSTSAAVAGVIAERLRVAVAAHSWTPRAVTVSVGVAWVNPVVRTDAALMLAADAALYRAKRQGRNCVVVMEY